MADGEHTGGFLGLVPDNAGELAVDGGDPPEQMHLTLLYLGDDVTGWAPEQADRLRELVTASAPALDPVDAQVMGHAVFNPGEDGPDPCAVYLIGDAPGLDPLRKWAQWVTTTHDDYPTPPPQHNPVIYHVTAGYGLSPDQLSYTGPVRFSTLRLALAGDVLDVPLGDQEAPVITETKSGEITFTPPADIIEMAAILPGPVARIVAEGKALNSRGVDWVEANCGQTGTAWAADMRARAGEIETKRDVPTAERHKLAKEGHTLKGTTSYPIKTEGDLDNAYQSWGRCKPEDRPALKKLLLKEARRLKVSQDKIDKIQDLGGSEPDNDADDTGKKDIQDGIETKVASPDPRAQKLRNFWAYSPKGRAKWKPGSKGDFKRLRRHLAKYVHTPRVLNGLTANIHKLATGEWPGKNAHTLKGNVGKPLNMGKVVGKSLVDWVDDIEIKAAALAVDDPDVAGLFDGVDDWGQQFAEPWTVDYIADLGDLGDAADGPDTEAGEAPADDVLLDTARHAQIAARMIPDTGSAADAGSDTSDGLPNLFDAEPVSA